MMYSLYYAGDLPHVRLGRRAVRFKLADLRQYVEDQTATYGQPR